MELYNKIHYKIAPIETRRPIKVGYHDALRALQSVPLLAVFFVSQHESSRVFGYLLHKSSALLKERIKLLTANVVELGSFHSKFLLGIAVYCRKNTLR